jgi:hypothetical protein
VPLAQALRLPPFVLPFVLPFVATCSSLQLERTVAATSARLMMESV